MKKILAILIVISIILVMVSFRSCESKSEKTTYIPSNMQNMQFCPNGSTEFCNIIPDSVNIPDSLGTKLNGYSALFNENIQPYFDIFSWQSFISLNWSSNGDFNDNISPRNWEKYADPDTVFTKNSLVSISTRGKIGNKKILYMTSKFSLFSQSDGNTLIDKNLNFVVFEEKINPNEFDFINRNGLRTEDGQIKYAKKNDSIYGSITGISLPGGGDGGIGSIEIKASWRILTSDDKLSSYYHESAIIYIDAEHSKSGKPLEIEAEVGLVGMHIMHKTNQNGGRFWIWSTFEHIDNIPDNLQEDQESGKIYSFYNPNCIGCQVNNPPVPNKGDDVVKWDTVQPYAYDYATSVRGEQNNKRFGTQVVRVYPIYYYTELVNNIWREKLKGTIWENYRLIGSQWGGISDSGFPRVLVSAPKFLGNSTMETYIPETTGCISCHIGATIAGSDSFSSEHTSDMSFLFYHATKVKRNKK